MAHFGERDTMDSVAGVRKLAAAHPDAQVFTYDADHGFNCDQRGSYDAAAAKLTRAHGVSVHFSDDISADGT